MTEMRREKDENDFLPKFKIILNINKHETPSEPSICARASLCMTFMRVTLYIIRYLHDLQFSTKALFFIYIWKLQC